MKSLVGGTFDPIHYGHLIPARDAAESLGFDKVILVPSALGVHKANKSDFKHRYNMCCRAVENDDLFQVSDIESIIAKECGNSYTCNVAKELRKFGDVYWFIGADSIPKVLKWYNQKLLKEIVTFVIAKRPGYPDNEHLLQDNGFRWITVPNTVIDISSSDIRARIIAKKSIRYLTPESVDDYIFCNHLYQVANVVI